MAFNNVGRFFLAPGASIRVWIGWPAPGDRGAQWIMAHPLPGNPTELVVSEHAKELNYEIGWVRSDGSSGYAADSIYYRYLATVRNRGRYGAYFSLSGGGNA